MIKRKYVVLSLLTLVSIVLVSLSFTNITQANSTVTGYVSVSPSAFTPYIDTTSYYKTNAVLHGDGVFFSPIQLPHGATITNMTVYLHDSVIDGNVFVTLKGYNLTAGLHLDMGYVTSSV